VGADDEPMGQDPHRDQLRQGTYPPYNRVIHGPPGTDVGSLWIEVNTDTESEPGRRLVVTASSWDLDDRQRAMIEAGAHLRVSMWVYPIPPMSVAVEAPFCGCHAEEMVFNDDGGFSCRHLLEVGGDGDHDIDAEGQLRRDFSPAEDDEAEGGDLAGPGAPSDPPQS
jgi:hypothetical protein